ncbi:MAG: ATPase [Candidatus Cryptobacteroides sp.]
MKLIVESGATKSDWRLVEDGKQVGQYLLPGMNVSSMSLDAVKRTLGEGLSRCGAANLEGFYLYTAGVVTPGIRASIHEYADSLISIGDFDFQNDMLAAARSVCGHSSGIVAIIGTGSNSCFYDGESISQNVYAGGFILGDEGAGSALGKMFLADYLKGEVPEPLKSDFESRFDSSYSAIVANVYKGPSPAGYLGSIAPLVVSHYSEPYARELVDRNFRNFIRRSLMKYDYLNHPVGVVGGFAGANREIFSRLCSECGIRVSRYVMEPVEGLIEYHCGRI